MLNVRIAGDGGTFNISQLARTITWSGDIRQCARTLSFGLLSSPVDTSIPIIPCALGNAAGLYLDGAQLFDGFVFARAKSTASSVIDVTCYDRGIYLKRNRTSVKFTNTTPEDIAAQVAADFGIPVGKLACTGVKISRNFPGSTLYDIIQTAYTLASAQTGVKYQTLFKLDRLYVIEKAVDENTLIIEGGSNLLDAVTTESIENLVTQVAIYDENDNLRQTIRNESLIRLYGVMQEYVKDKDVETAQKLLDDHDVSQKITVNCIGNTRSTAGGTVIVREPYTGLYGLFYIDADTHTWKNGLYTNKLVLNFKNIMDEKEVGTAKKAKNSGGAVWQYINPPKE